MFQKHTTLPPTVHPVDPKTYHADTFPRGDVRKTMSQSELKRYAKCPHRWLKVDDEEVTDAMDDGSLADVVILSPETFEKTYAVAPEKFDVTVMKCPVCGSETDSASCRKCGTARVSTTIQKDWDYKSTACCDWRDAQIAKGFEVTKAQQAADAWKARDVFFENEHIAKFHAVSRKQVQVNVEWRDDDTGLIIPVKCLLDIVPDPESEYGDTLADLKRTNNGEYLAWCKQVFNFGLHVQAAFYIDAINVALGLEYRNFEHHIQESFAPWETTHRPLSDDFITLGRTSYRAAFIDYCRAVKSGKFRGYDTATVEPESYMV